MGVLNCLYSILRISSEMFVCLAVLPVRSSIPVLGPWPSCILLAPLNDLHNLLLRPNERVDQQLVSQATLYILFTNTRRPTCIRRLTTCVSTPYYACALRTQSLRRAACLASGDRYHRTECQGPFDAQRRAKDYAHRSRVLRYCNWHSVVRVDAGWCVCEGAR